MSHIRISGKPGDQTNWEKLIQQTETSEELTDIEKEKAKCSFFFLTQEFGEEFLRGSLKGLQRENLNPVNIRVKGKILLFGELSIQQKRR
jgi:hypothetical protein